MLELCNEQYNLTILYVAYTWKFDEDNGHGMEMAGMGNN